MRFLIVLSAVLLAQSAAFGQTCANGQCQRPSAAQYQTFTPRVMQAAPTFAPACQPAAPERQGLLARIQERREERKAARAAR